MAHDFEKEELNVIQETHDRVAQDVIESLINPMVMVGANANDVMVLLEAVNAAVLMWLYTIVGDEKMDLEEISKSLQHNTLVRITMVQEQYKNVNQTDPAGV